MFDDSLTIDKDLDEELSDLRFEMGVKNRITETELVVLHMKTKLIM